MAQTVNLMERRGKNGRKYNIPTKSVMVEHGDLVLVFVKDYEAPPLGIFAEVVDDYFCFAQRPFKLDIVTLPSNVLSAQFRRREISKYDHVIRGWESNLRVDSMLELYAGREQIITNLKTREEGKYAAHVETIERINPPYITDSQIAKKLGIKL